VHFGENGGVRQGEPGQSLARRRGCGAVALAVAFLLATPPAGAQTGSDWLYAARPGDTNWDLSHRYLRDWRRWPELQALNNIADPTRIPPGRIIRVPVAWLRAAPAGARAVAVEPPAEVRHPRQTAWQPLAVGQALSEGAEIATGPEGSATLQLADSSQVLIPSETRVVLDQLLRFESTPLADSRLRLERGRLVPTEVPAGSRLSIVSPPATTSVRGTDFRTALEDNATRLDAEVLRGSVAVAGAGRQQPVAAGYGVTTRVGQPPQPPRPLLRPPDVGSVPQRSERVPFTVAVVPLAGAVRYRFQVSQDDFQTLLVDVLADGPSLRVPAVPDGRYVWRVRGIDAGGLEGRDAFRAVEIDARPEPPAPMLPRRAGRVREATPRFAWAEPVGALGYRFRLTPANAPDRPIVDEVTLTAAEFVPSRPVPVGEYAWQVATRAADGEIGPLSDPQPFTRLEPLPVPEPEVGAATSDELVLRLPNASPGARYQVQLAEDIDFADLALDRVLEEPELRVQHLYPGTYFLRARTIEADGYEGAFSAPQRVDVLPARWWPLFAIPLGIILLALL
jgi:hypothetical protein